MNAVSHAFDHLIRFEQIDKNNAKKEGNSESRNMIMTIILIVAFNAFNSKSQNVIVIDKLLYYYIMLKIERRIAENILLHLKHEKNVLIDFVGIFADIE